MLAQHQRLPRTSFAHRGHVVDTQTTPSRSRQRARGCWRLWKGQLALRSHTWPDGVQVNLAAVQYRPCGRGGQPLPGLAVHRAVASVRLDTAGRCSSPRPRKRCSRTRKRDTRIFLQETQRASASRPRSPGLAARRRPNGLPESFPPLRAGRSLRRRPKRPYNARGGGRPAALLVAAALFVAVAAIAAVLATRGSSEGLSGIQPNHVGVIDPETNDIVAEVPVGIRPGPVAAGDGSVWVGNLRIRA